MWLIRRGWRRRGGGRFKQIFGPVVTRFSFELRNIHSVITVFEDVLFYPCTLVT